MSNDSEIFRRNKGEIPRGGSPLEYIQRILDSMRYGTVNITVQDGVIVHIERTDKFRLKSANNHS